MGIDRKHITKLLSHALTATTLCGMGKHWASEVTLNYGTAHPKRVDFMLFEPQNAMSISGIEKGIFTCYEIKSCIDDLYSGNGLNFVGERNYIVTTMQNYKDNLIGKEGETFGRWYMDNHKDDYNGYGIMVAVPAFRDMVDEFDNPTPLDDFSEDINQLSLRTIIPCYKGKRTRSMTELLFCMLRSGR